MTQYGFFIDTSCCTGCKTCQVSCKDINDLPVGPKFMRIYEYGGGEWQQQGAAWQQDVFNYFVPVACFHCSAPTCLSACPTGALQKRQEDGLVIIEESLCDGCRLCESACPYGALQFQAEKNRMGKCDGCHTLVSQGRKPVCVDSCPQRALDFAEMGELRRQYGSENSIAPLPDPQLTEPNLVIKRHKKARPSGDNVGAIQNRDEI